MKKISVDSIQGGEILAKDIYLENGSILMTEGAVIRTAYIDRLKQLGYESIYIVDKMISTLLDKATEQVIQKSCKDAVRKTIDRYSYGLEAELSDIADIADKIIQEILIQPEVLYNISRIRDKSESMYLHSINVSALSVLIGAKLHLTDRRLKNMAIGALLHDIGMVYLSVDTTNLNLETCDEATMKEVRKHVIYGYSAVEREEWLAVAAKDIIINHHERLDGSGYPFHLTAEKISLETKIVALCDEFDNQAYGNYIEKRKTHLTMDYITSQAGVKFDFKVVQTFIASVAVYPLGTVVCTNENETGIVIRQNENVPTRPVIRLITSPKNGKYKVGEEKDLTVSLTTFIIDTIEI